MFPSHVSPNPPSPSQHVMLVNVTHMISDQKKITQLGQSQDYSPLFRIILPTTWGSQITSERWGSGSTFDAVSPVPISPTSPSAYQPNSSGSGRRISAYPSPSTTERFNPIYQVVTTTLQQQLQKYIHDEETALESRIKKFEEEQREAFEAKAEKGRRDRTYLLNLIRSSSLDESTAVKSLRARQGSTSSSHEGADDVFNKPKRRESAPTRPINIASGPNVNYPGVPTALTNLGSPLGVGSPVYGGLIEVNNRGSSGSGSPAILKPVTLTLPLTNQNANNNVSSPRGNREFTRPTSPPAGLFSMDDDEDDDGDRKSSKVFDEEEEEEEEEELEDLGDARNCSPFEAIESSDVDTDPDDNSLEDLRTRGLKDSRGGIDLPFIPSAPSDRERKYSKYSTSAPMNIAAFPQMNKGTVDIPLDEVGAAEEEESGTMEPVAAAPEPDPAQIAASMQALVMSERDEDDPESIFGERPRRRLNTLELYQIRQFKRPTTVAKRESTVNAPGLSDEGFPSIGGLDGGF